MTFLNMSREPRVSDGKRSMRSAITSSTPFLLALLAMTGIVTDFQGVVYNPLVGVMSQDLGLTLTQTGWVINSLSVASAFALGLSARYADIIGHKKVLVPLVALGVVGSALSAVAPGFLLMIVGRVLVGLAISAPMAWAILKVRGNERTMERASLMNGTVISIATPIGLILGGVLLAVGTSWTASFWIIGGGYFVLLIMCLVVPETPAAMRIKVPLDWLGALGLATWLICVLVALSEGNSWGWGSGAVIGLFIGAGAVFFLWVVQQRKTPNALMDFRGMDLPQVISGYTIYFTVAVLASGLYLLLPSLAQAPTSTGYGFGASQLASSLTLLPILPATFVAAAISNYLLKRVGPRPPMVVGGILCVVSFVLYAFVHSQMWQLYLGTAIYGVGIVICFNIGWALVSASGRQDNMSITFGIQYSMALPGGALVVAILLAILEAGKAGGVSAESAYTVNFLILGGFSLVGFALVGLFVVPRRLRHYTDKTRVTVAAGTDPVLGTEGVGAVPPPSPTP